MHGEEGEEEVPTWSARPPTLPERSTRAVVRHVMPMCMFPCFSSPFSAMTVRQRARARALYTRGQTLVDGNGTSGREARSEGGGRGIAANRFPPVGFCRWGVPTDAIRARGVPVRDCGPAGGSPESPPRQPDPPVRRVGERTRCTGGSPAVAGARARRQAAALRLLAPVNGRQRPSRDTLTLPICRFAP